MHCSNLFSIPEQVRLAKRLVEKIGKGKLLFCNSGAEANEGMIKLVRLNENQRNKNPRHNILVAGNGFHGRTLGALSATESPKYRKGFEPLLPSFDFAPLNDIEAFDRAINDNTSAVLVESIQGEGGIFVADDSFLQELSALVSRELRQLPVEPDATHVVPLRHAKQLPSLRIALELFAALQSHCVTVETTWP